jgi:tetratricopeptide (TPR) repeat protein
VRVARERQPGQVLDRLIPARRIERAAAGVPSQDLENLHVEQLGRYQSLLGGEQADGWPLGEDHPSTLRILNILGLVYIDLGRYEQAHTMFVNNLERRRRVLGEEHPETLLSMGNLGLALRNLERFDDAIDVYREALELQERAMGAGHPDTAVSLYNLGQLHRITGRFDLSAGFIQRAIEVDEKTLGAEHPYVADDLEELAKLRREMGLDAEADELEARVRAIRGE